MSESFLGYRRIKEGSVAHPCASVAYAFYYIFLSIDFIDKLKEGSPQASLL